jgi:Secretion system C-terminal sorting domain
LQNCPAFFINILYDKPVKIFLNSRRTFLPLMKMLYSMRKIFTSIAVVVTLCCSILSNAQTFSVAHDTVYQTVNGSAVVKDNITNLTSGNLNMKWKVLRSDFPADWVVDSVFGICDACICNTNLGDTAIWNATTHVGATYSCANYMASATSLFELSLNYATVPSGGTHYMTVAFSDGVLGGTSHNETFIISHWTTGIANVNTQIDHVMVFPNPASDAATVSFGLKEAGEVTFTVLDETGRVVAPIQSHYFNGGNNQIDLNSLNLQSGIYQVVLNEYGSKAISKLVIVR